MYIRTIKFLSGIFIAIIFLFGVGILALPYLVSTDMIRIRLAQDLSAWTGYNVQLHDPPRLNLFPYPKAYLSGVTLTSKMDNTVPLMEAESIEVDLSLVDLLWGGYVSFSETRIVRPQFVMTKPIKTVADFFDRFSQSKGALGLAIRHAREILKHNPDHPDIEHLLKQPFGRIAIENGVLVYHDRISSVAEKITGLNATLDWPKSTQKAQFRADARWRGELTKLSIDADQALLLLAGGKSQIKASLNSVRGAITFIGQVRLSEYYTFDGKVSMRSPSWNQTLSWIGGNPFLGDRLKVPIVWESHFSVQPMHIQMNNITFAVGTANARGALELNFQDYVPVVIGSLAFDNLDFNLFGSVFSSKGEHPFFDMKTFDRIGVDVRLSAPQAKIGNIDLTNLAAAIQIRNGHGIFDLGHANVLGGSLQSNIEVVSIGKKVRIKGQASGTSVDIQDASEVLGIVPFAQSKADFTMTVETFASSWSEILKKMQGELTMSMLSGQLLGYDLNALQIQLLKNEQFVLTSHNSLSTAFDRWDIQASFSDGTVKIIESLMQTADWNLSLWGMITSLSRQDRKNEFTLQAQLRNSHSSETLCRDVQCLANSLMQPFAFSLDSQGQDRGNFLVIKDIHAD
ncbi:AsmA protein [Bartonella silvatica]|uniref:AsmA protein n=1 Tax=Bartonella silvatica TaxID=357760 RepID=A0ABV2HFL5_9HYPH